MSAASIIATPQASDFDLEDPTIQADPYAFYPILREQKPVLKSIVNGQPCWVISRRKDISAILMDTATYSSNTTPGLKSILQVDPPEHGRLRQMVAAMFTKPVVQGMEGEITVAAERIFRDCVAAVRFDAVSDFASPLSIYVMGKLLGVPVNDVLKIRSWTKLSAEAVSAMRTGRTPSEESVNARAEMAKFFMDMAEANSYAEDGVLASLAQIHRDGGLDATEFVAFAVLLFVAGHSTTTNLMGNAMYMLTQRSQDLARIQEDEEFIAPFLEEVLRTRPSFHRIVRKTTREVELHGEVIPAGSIVRLLLASANHDPDGFPDGETFDPDRKGRMHMAFAQGVHSCLGSWLARLEAKTAMKTVGKFISKISLDPVLSPTPFTGGTFNEFGFEHLPVIIQPR